MSRTIRITRRAVAGAALIAVALTGIGALLLASVGGIASPTPGNSDMGIQNDGGCLRVDGGCIGVLDAGDHASFTFDPFGTEAPGQLSYRARDGWANSFDHRYGYWFQQAEPYVEQKSQQDGEHRGGVFLWADAALAIQDGSCSEQQEPGGPTGAAPLREALRAIPGLALIDLPDRRIGGFPAYGFDAQVAADALVCGSNLVPLIAGREGKTDPYMWAMARSEGLRGWFVDLGERRTVAVFVTGPREDLGDLLPSAEELIATIRFEDLQAARRFADQPRPGVEESPRRPCLWIEPRVYRFSLAGVPTRDLLCAGAVIGSARRQAGSP